MLTEIRQNRSDSIITEFQKIPGVKCVWRDDFDSVGMNIFFQLKCSCQGGYSNNPWRFAKSIRSIKAAIARTCRNFNVEFRFTDWPAKKYSSSYGEKHDEGYDTDMIGIDANI